MSDILGIITLIIGGLLVSAAVVFIFTCGVIWHKRRDILANGLRQLREINNRKGKSDESS